MGTPLPFIDSVTNPFPAQYGLDSETPNVAKALTRSFQAVTYRAVRPEDYQEAAERLPWVQKAGASFRWTGSWITAFVTGFDPMGAVVLADDERIDLVNQLDRFRQAGRQVYVFDPEYANIDLQIEICVSADDYPGEVKKRVYRSTAGQKRHSPAA